MLRSEAISFLSAIRQKVEAGLISKDAAEKLAVLALEEVAEAPQEKAEQKEPVQQKAPEAKPEPTPEPVDPKSRILAALTKLEQSLSPVFKSFQDEITSLLKETSGAAAPLGEFSIGAEELDAKVAIAQKDATSVVCTYTLKQDWDVADLELPAPVTASFTEDACHLGLRRELLSIADEVLDNAGSALAWSRYKAPKGRLAGLKEKAKEVRDLRVVQAAAKTPASTAKAWKKWALATVTHLLGSDYVLSVKLDGEGKDFSKHDLDNMRKDLLSRGYKKPEVESMDDQDLLGTWQAETGYLDADD